MSMTSAMCTHCLPDETSPSRAPGSFMPLSGVSISVSRLPEVHPTYKVDWKRADEVKVISFVSPPIQKTVIEFEGRIFRFRGQPLFVVLEPTDGCWRFTTDDPVIEGCADTPAEALEQLACRLAYLWDEYACEDDARLGKLAQRIKRSILRRVSVDDAAACGA
jgi:hypothetical protein